MNKFQWTAIFLVKGAADNSREFSQLLNQLAAVNKTPGVAVIVGINIRAENIPELLKKNENIATTSGWTTLFYSLESEAGGGCRFQFRSEKQDFKLASQGDVSNFLKNEVLAAYVAERYVLFTWDHGQPFGIFPEPDNDLDDDVVVETAEELFSTVPLRLAGRLANRSQLKHSKRSVANVAPEDELPILTIVELRQAIEWAFGNDKIDVLVMANCYQQFFDTGYELSDCVDYLIAFETEMFFRDAYDYKMIIEALSNDPQLTPENLAKSIVSSYSMQRTRQNLASKNSVALFANNLSWYPVVAKLIDELALSLMRELPRYHDRIMRAIDACEYLSPNIPSFCLIDFRNFLHCLHNELPSLFNVTPYEYFETVLRQLVTASYIGNDFTNEKNFRFRSPSCFSIYLPKDHTHYQTSFLTNFMNESALSPTSFVKRFHWEIFIHALMERAYANTPALAVEAA